jgi:chitodextrinase
MTSFRVNWSYSIDNVGIKEYEVYRNGTLVGTTPTNVAASKETTSGFAINWTHSADNLYVLGYNIYLNGKYHASVTNGANSYTFSGLTSSTNYNVQILAYDVAKNRFGLSTNVTALTK